MSLTTTPVEYQPPKSKCCNQSAAREQFLCTESHLLRPAMPFRSVYGCTRGSAYKLEEHSSRRKAGNRSHPAYLAFLRYSAFPPVAIELSLIMYKIKLGTRRYEQPQQINRYRRGPCA